MKATSVVDALPVEEAESLRREFLKADFKPHVYTANMPYDRSLDKNEFYSCSYSRSIDLEASLPTACAKLSLPAGGDVRMMAYRLTAGDYFRWHHDSEISFIYYLSKGWKLDWGGVLHVCAEEGTSTFLPEFNKMVLIDRKVPHFVSVVAKHAKEPRYAVTGFIS